MYVYKKGTVFRQFYPLFKSWAMRSRRSGSWALGKYYIGYGPKSLPRPKN